MAMYCIVNSKGLGIMIRPMHELIARRCFASLYVDYEHEVDEIFPASCTCRILVDGWFKERFTVENREKAIEYFENWKEQ